MRSALRCVLVCCGVFSVVVPAGAAGAALGGGPWSPPVNGPVVRAFDPPATPFGPGHLGVDFATAPATAVRAAGDGVVVFAGRVGTGLHVVIRHPGDIRTSCSFLATTQVVTGQRVERGAIVGTSGGAGPGHGAGVLHFAVRVGATYVDPMLLFAPPDLAAVVHLAPPRGGAAANSRPMSQPASISVGERSALVAGLRVDARARPEPPAWWDETRAQPRSGTAPREWLRRASATTGRPATTSGPGLSGVALALAAVSLAGVAAGRRRRSRRS